MLWAIDVGNTATKWARWTESGGFEFLETFSTPTGDALIEALRESTSAEQGAVAIASVVPAESARIAEFLDSQGVPHRFLNADNAGIDVRYETPQTLGADRLANAAGLAESGDRPAVAVDFGTAAKLDAVDVSGAYLGGAILPGIDLMIRSLAQGTAQLPEVPAEPPEQAIGRSTAACLQSGTVLALAMAIEGLLAEFERELGAPARIVGTGGRSPDMKGLCPSIRQWDPHLTLKGLAIAGRRWLDSGWARR